MLINACWILVLAGALWTATSAGQSIRDAPAHGGASGVLSSTFPAIAVSSAPPFSVDELKQLLAPYQDPQRREALRTETRLHFAKLHPDLIEILDLEPAMQQQLIELLTDQSLDSAQQRYEAQLASLLAGTDELNSPYQATAADYTRTHGAISQLLGAARFARYIDYRATFVGRFELAPVIRRLGSDALNRQQREAMVELLAERSRAFAFVFDRAMEADNREAFDIAAMLTSVEQRAFYSRRHHLKIAEASVTRRLAFSTQLLQASTQILTASQQAVFAAFEDEQLETTRFNVRQFRQEGNFDPDAPIAAFTMDRRPCRVRWSLNIAVDRNAPQVLSFVGDVGRAVTFEIGAGLTVEAIPTMYASRLYLDMKAYEVLGDGRRHVIGNLNSRTYLQPVPNPQWTRWTEQTALCGSRGYFVELSVIAAKE
jgi:hypothetical protein